jgi:hypothetical protein
MDNAQKESPACRAPAAKKAAAVLITAALAVVLAALLAGSDGCAHVGTLNLVPQTMTPADTTGGHHPELAARHTAQVHALFGPDTIIGFQPGTGDSSRRYLGRLRGGYTADTLNIILVGDNRPGFRMRSG